MASNKLQGRASLQWSSMAKNLPEVYNGKGLVKWIGLVDGAPVISISIKEIIDVLLVHSSGECSCHSYWIM